jgi:hypothetical protein
MWTTFPDLQLGVIDASRNAQKLIAVRYFSTLANYAVGDFVVQAGALYAAVAASAPGAFNAANWSKLVNAADAAALPYVPVIGGAILGNLSISGVLSVLGSNSMVLNTLTQGQQRAILAQTNGANRWQMILADSAAESGANSGSNFTLNALSDAGSVLRAVLTIARDTGVATFGGPVTLAGPPTLPLHAATKAYVDSGAFVPIAGNVAMTGPLTLAANPAAPLQPATKQYVDALPVAVNPNRLDNGDMWVDQHNGGASVAMPANGQIYCPDRWWFWNVQATSRFNVGQNYPAAITTKPPGFQYFVGIQSTSAYTSAAASTLYLQHGIEADAIGDLGFGTAGAQPITVSFWARSSLTGNFSFAIQSTGIGSAYRTYVTTYSLPIANTWTKIVIPIPGDVGGTTDQWPNVGNVQGMYLVFDIGSGANVQTSALNSWQASAAYVATGAVHVTGTNNANWAITGVKLEAGSVATPFPVEDLARKLIRCQRYFQKGQFAFAGYMSGVSTVYTSQSFPVQMRATPTMTITANNSGNVGAPTWASNAPGGSGMTLMGATAVSGGYVLNVNYNASAEI